MARHAPWGLTLAALLALAACQGGGKFQYVAPDAGSDLPVADAEPDADPGPSDRGPDVPGQCGPGLPADTCEKWAKETYGPCKKGRCNEEEGLCQAYNEPDGTTCDDGDPCTEDDACGKGACAGTALSCDDGLACTADRCDPDQGCLHEPDDEACDDGDFCNGLESCDPAQGCVTTPKPAEDPSCDGVDQDCDGATDDDYVPDAACLDACGLGGAASACVDGQVVPCQPPVAADDDATCDGVDDDCSGQADEDYRAVVLCGTGACADAAVASSCLLGVETPCQPGAAAADDGLCNNADDDCDGSTDEDYVVVSQCGLGVCARDAVPSSCAGGVETACRPGLPAAADDATCDGLDQDCDGGTDEDYVPVTRCGVGPCADRATASFCLGGLEVPCQPGKPAATKDATCDGVDEDCSGQADEDYLPVLQCGTGACRAASTPSACSGGTETPCQPGPPAASDAACDGIDDDCDGTADQQACHAGGLCWDDGAACDDGLPFTAGDLCDRGTCAGVADDCAPALPPGPLVALRDLALGRTGFPGEGLDVDGDPATCAPAQAADGTTPGCGGGVDNGLALLEPLLGPLSQELLASFTQGSVMVDFGQARLDGVPFPLPFHLAEVGPTTPGCDPKAAPCDFVLAWHNFDAQCNPLYQLDNATIVSGLLTAGGPSHAFTVPTRYGVDVTVFGVQVRATPGLDGGRVASLPAGSLAGGAVRIDQALALLEAAFPGPDDTVLYQGYTKGFVRNVLQNLLDPDWDTDGDGVPDAVTFGMRAQAQAAPAVDVGTPCTAAAQCDDGDPCTDDVCLPEAGCTNPARTPPCGP